MEQYVRRMGLVGVIVLLALFWLVPVAGAQASDSIDADDQAVANGSVKIAEVNASKDGWLVIHLDEGGKPGKVIGHSAVKAGETYDVMVKLEQDVADGGKVWPMLHIDAGTIGTYEFPGPDAPVIINNNIVMKQITLSAKADAGAASGTDSLDAEDQAISNGSIVVERVVASQAGWIAVHLDEGGKPGRVIGHGAVKQGANSNVTIKLDETAAAGTKLWPMLHIDAGTIGTYEFPGPDAPVVVNNNIVMKQIAITAGSATPATGSTGKPAQLPTTGGNDAPYALLLAAMIFLIAGGWISLRRRA